MDFLTNYKEEIIFGLSAVALKFAQVWYEGDKQIFELVDSATEYSAGSKSLRDAVLQQQSTIPYAAIRGRVVPTTPVTVPNASKMEAVIQSTYSTDKSLSRVSSSLIWISNWTKTQSGFNFAPFGLRDPREPSSSPAKTSEIVTVDNVAEWSQLNFPKQPLTLVPIKRERVESIDMPIFQLILGYITGTLPIATYEEEHILPVDAIVTIFGTVSELADGKLRISSPELDAAPFILVMGSGQYTKLSYKMTMLCSRSVFEVIAIGAAISAVFVVRKWWNKTQIHRVHRTVAAGRNADGNPIEGLANSQICIVCLGRPREVILLPCGHVCVCGDCCLQLHNKCPVCRVIFDCVHQAYIV